MRTAQKPANRTQSARTASVSSPVGGWNAIDPISSMPPEDAVILDNFFCTPYDVMVRAGSSNWTTGFSQAVDTLAVYAAAGSVQKMFAWSGANVYDVSNAGALGAAVVSGLTAASDKWQTVSFGTAGGEFLICCNGVDLPLVYNGSAWGNIQGAAFNTAVTSITSVGTTATVTMAAAHLLKTGMSVTITGFTPSGYNGTYIITVTGASTFTYTLAGALGVTTVTGTLTPTAGFAITGVNPATFINVKIFKARLWFTAVNSLIGWYMPALSIGGAAQPVDISNLCSHGGYLMAMADWTLDAGYGMDDYLVMASSNGDVVVYRGTDPASSTTWFLVGVFYVGSPVGRRCMTQFAGDLLFISQDGLTPLSKAMMSSRVNMQQTLTYKIQHIISTYITTYGSNFGWETTLFPKENMLVLNVPFSNTQSYQLIMNTISGAWSRFLGWNAKTFVLFNDFLYYGDAAGKVVKAWDTQADIGLQIPFEAQQSFNYFGSAAQIKKIQMVRPTIATDGSPGIFMGVNAAFDTTAPTGVPTFTPSTAAMWDSAVWDSAVWGGGLNVKNQWQTPLAPMSYAFAAHMVGFTQGSQLRWSSTDYVLSDGGIV
jgi:hypothetical protein